MAHMFERWPVVSYDLDKKGKPLELTNITVRFKINELLLNKTAVMYEYNVLNGERADIIAHKYYEDATLDWVIYLINSVIDPQFEWPMDERSFERYMKRKYGSLATAKQTHHQYEITLREQSVLFDDTIVPEKRLVVDKDTYDLTSPSLRRQVDKYTYEWELNNSRSLIKVLDKKYLPALLSTYSDVIKQV